ncbi:MAG: glycosyltransferase [bacterium]|nr:glycosyltransferase [bacterium]
MTNSPLVSIIVPVYNTGPYLRTCLDSICGQTYSKLEIICVNDGSTDDSAAILSEYAAKDERIKVFSQKNAGLAAARNVGLQCATGEWIGGVDADDYIVPDTIEYALSKVTVSIDVIYFGFEKVWPISQTDGISNWSWDLHVDEGEHKISVKVLLDLPISFCTYLWRRSFLEKTQARFPEGLWYEDLMFCWQTLPYGRNIYNSHEHKYKYVQRADSIMAQSRDKCTKGLDHLVVWERLLQWRQLHPLPKDLELLDFYNAIYCHQASKIYSQEDYHLGVDKESHRLIKQYGLMKKWPILRWLIGPVTGISRLFVRRKKQRLTFSLLGLPVLSYSTKKLECPDFLLIKRIFGIKIKKRMLS